MDPIVKSEPGYDVFIYNGKKTIKHAGRVVGWRYQSSLYPVVDRGTTFRQGIVRRPDGSLFYISDRDFTAEETKRFGEMVPVQYRRNKQDMPEAAKNAY